MARRREGSREGSASGREGENAKSGGGGEVSISGGVAGNRSCGKAQGRQAEMGTGGSKAHDEEGHEE